jgi:hypothetical protein
MLEIAKQIAIRAPEATTVFVQYLTLVPEALCDKIGLTEEKAARSRLIAKRLSEITTAAAEENGAEVLRVDTLSKDHTACDADPWSMASPQQDDILNGTAWHPNRRGHEAIAEVLRSMLSQ